jgi:hypothetical protein
MPPAVWSYLSAAWGVVRGGRLRELATMPLRLSRERERLTVATRVQKVLQQVRASLDPPVPVMDVPSRLDFAR